MASALRMGPPTLCGPCCPPGPQGGRGLRGHSPAARLLYSIHPRVCEAHVPTPSWDPHCDKRSSEQPPTWEPPESADTGRWHRASPTPHLPASAQCLGRPSIAPRKPQAGPSPTFPREKPCLSPVPTSSPVMRRLSPGLSRPFSGPQPGLGLGPTLRATWETKCSGMKSVP